MFNSFTVTIAASPDDVRKITVHNLDDLYAAIHSFGAIDEGFEPETLDPDDIEVLCEDRELCLDDIADEVINKVMTPSVEALAAKLDEIKEVLASHDYAIRRLLMTRGSCTCKDKASKKNKGSKKPSDHRAEVPASACVASSNCGDSAGYSISCHNCP